jgi:hypothetical protein
MARHWRDIRAEAVASGRVDPARADAARKEMHHAVQAQRLADIRKAHHARQADVAALMGVSQAWVSHRVGDAAVVCGCAGWEPPGRRRV